MKAAQIKQFGHADAVEIVDIQTPVIQPGMVLVEVKAASLNPIDTAVREGYTQSWAPVELPVTLGGDIAGIVSEVGDGVTGFQVGDKVYGQASALGGGSGALAEYALTKPEQLGLLPENIDFNEAASLPLVGVSALQGLKTHINLQPDQKILITGGAGGIGTAAIQIAKYLGAHVVTTVGTQAVDYAKQLGANEVIDYATQEVGTDQEFDAVFDTVGGETFQKALAMVKQGGTAVTMAGQSDEAKSQELGITIIGQMTHVNTAALDELSALITSKSVTPHVASTFTLDQAKEAFQARENESIIGKVVVSIKD